MKKLILAGVLLVLGSILYYLLQNKPFSNSKTLPPKQANISKVTTVSQNLEVPWAIAFLPDGNMLITERPGRVRLINSNGKLESDPVAVLNQVKEEGEGGLLGIDIHPNFSAKTFVYLYYTFSGNGGNTLNRVVRMSYQNKQLTDEEIIVDNIPGASNHNGGRIKFGPDNLLYITTGDAQNPSQSQDINSLAGKILRVTDEGRPAPGNPFNNLVYSYGHRNTQGIAWDSRGQLWATEHGRSTPSGFDEINLIQPGKNYGWPTIEGDKTADGLETPKFNSGATKTWAPSGAEFVDNSLFFAGLRGQTLYEAVIENNQVVQVREHLSGEYGRLREVILGSDNLIYITTSNRDGRGNPDPNDDKIIRLNPRIIFIPANN